MTEQVRRGGREAEGPAAAQLREQEAMLELCKSPVRQRILALASGGRAHVDALARRMPVDQKVSKLQVAEAQRLMAAGTPLRDVAALAGFAHQSHFVSRFRRGFRQSASAPRAADQRTDCTMRLRRRRDEFGRASARVPARAPSAAPTNKTATGQRRTR